jgi:hypothetical protein
VTSGWSWVDCSDCGVHAQRVLTPEALDLCRKHFPPPAASLRLANNREEG